MQGKAYQTLPLPRRQFCTHFRIKSAGRVPLRSAEHVCCHQRPGSQLEHVAPGDRRYFADLASERSTEERRQFGCDEIARAAELDRTGGVVAKRGRVEDQLHVAVEADPAPRPCDLVSDELDHHPAVSEGVGVRCAVSGIGVAQDGGKAGEAGNSARILLDSPGTRG